MVDLSPAATLDIWATAQRLEPVDRAVALAAAAGAEAGEAARLPLGRRDVWLLDLHTALAGPMLEATASCPACGEPAEFTVDARELLAQERGAAAPEAVEADGFVVSWRSPDSTDAAAAAASGDAAEAERVLLERCVSHPVDLPAGARAAVAQAMADADPLAEVLVDVFCPGCGESFATDVDVAAFAWAELEARARRLLHEVGVLARAFGWPEGEILALDETRRAAYLALAQEGSA
jgi:hypothetical protein